MLVVLIGLGLWQLQRLAWKRDLLDHIARGEQAAPLVLPANPVPFQKVTVRGRLRADLVAYYGSDGRDTPSGPVLGAQLIMPLERADGDPILIDRGWFPNHAATPAATPSGETDIVGYVRAPEHAGWFAAPDDPAARRFYTLDPAPIGAALGLARVAPFVLVALGPAPDPAATPPAPVPAEHLPRPPNDHLQYAITWFALAATLAVIFGIFARKALRS